MVIAFLVEASTIYVPYNSYAVDINATQSYKKSHARNAFSTAFHLVFTYRRDPITT